VPKSVQGHWMTRGYHGQQFVQKKKEKKKNHGQPPTPSVKRLVLIQSWGPSSASQRTDRPLTLAPSFPGGQLMARDCLAPSQFLAWSRCAAPETVGAGLGGSGRGKSAVNARSQGKQIGLPRGDRGLVVTPFFKKKDYQSGLYIPQRTRSLITKFKKKEHN
jgi:hypothetical protein